ncbi:NUDIX domain-containing protein [Streptomyces sp. P38-E01]|uniref:NUDIX domain-containing protein n=2 Tax=Streptomyces tardus TaxID=2780544 RepID=A0A949JJU2_9ACTN|nr:NUDIX domain-containing protein [Streptomyces tardus]MBU7596476.1 NUDIX domain-containing protein [Streptomyces tardus]
MTLLAAAVIVHDRARDRLVLLQRGPNANFARGSWDLPVGKCDPGESVAAAAVRELREETGLLVREEDLALVHVVHGAHGAESPNGYLTVVFAADRWSGEPVNAEPAKHSRVCWVPFEEVPEDAVAPTFEATRLYRAGERRLLLTGWR